MLGEQIMTDCEKSLDLPMVRGQSRVSTFKEVHERISNQFMGWKEKFLSQRQEEKSL